LQMGEATMKQRGEGPEHFFEVVFQLTVVEQADGGVKERRHGEFDLIRLGQGAMIGLIWSGLCAMKSEVVEDCGCEAVIFGVGFVLKGHGLVPLFDLTRFGLGDNRAGGDRTASLWIAAQRRMRTRQKIVSRGMARLLSLAGQGNFLMGAHCGLSEEHSAPTRWPIAPLIQTGSD